MDQVNEEEEEKVAGEHVEGREEQEEEVIYHVCSKCVGARHAKLSCLGCCMVACVGRRLSMFAAGNDATCVPWFVCACSITCTLHSAGIRNVSHSY